MSNEIFMLKIRFRGICTHFRNVVPGIPHRVVLPMTEAIRVGTVNAPATTSANYYLIPHFAFLTTRGGPITDVTGILQSAANTGNILIEPNNSYLIGAARMWVTNPINDLGQPEVGPPQYLASYTTTKSLREFVPDYEYSEEVVQGGRAACYFDVFNGKIESGLTDGAASSVSIKMLTDGPPQLMVMPIQPLAAGTPPQLLTLTPDPPPDPPLDPPGVPTVTLTVANLELNSGETNDPQFDYLLHYLTAKAGIPRVIAKMTPGMTDPRSQNAAEFAQGIIGFANIISPPALLAAIAKINVEDVTPSCSDSRYP
jgi:hypothetical protein